MPFIVRGSIMVRVPESLAGHHSWRLSAVDPLNLTSVVTPGARVPATLGRFVTYVDGVPQAEEAAAGAAGDETMTA